MSVLLALASAIAYGSSDFLAGVMARRANVILVSLLGQAAAAAVSWVALPFAGGSPGSNALLWGAIAGIGGWVGTVFLYRGLARGRMSVVGPLSAVFTASGSAVAGVLLGDRPTPIEITGIAVACVAVAMVSTGVRPDRLGSARPASGVLDGALAGAGFTSLFVALNRAGDGAGLWPVAMTQSTALFLALAFTVALVVHGKVRVEAAGRVWSGAIPAGLLGGAATFAYFYATHLGLLTIAAVLTSLYPAATVALAVLVLRERLRPVQSIGLGLAAVSVALLASRV